MKFFIVITLVWVFSLSAYATKSAQDDTIVTTLYTIIDDVEEDFLKHTLKCNMLHLHNDEPEVVTNILAMLLEGVYYGRLRFNSFGFAWDQELDQAREDHAIGAVGGSFIYRTAYLHGFGLGAGFYTTNALGTLDDSQSALYKAGKDTFSRYKNKTTLNTFAQAYLEYRNEDLSIKAGRQIFESFLTKSNDTKMIPNTFEGVTLHHHDILDSSVKMAYLTRQKLRDHSSFHSLLASGNSDNEPYHRYTQNDDSAMHRGLLKSKLDTRGIEDKLIILEAKNISIENVTFMMNYSTVPDLITSAMIQGDYRFNLDNLSVIPAFRYMKQFDNGAGEIGGANLKTITHGYTDPTSLNSALYGARVDIVQDTFKLRFGYTKIADQGDIVAPWRGFPTGGFTRAMAQYNWHANTKSYMVQLDYEFNEIEELKVISRFVKQDFDDNKDGVQADSNVFTIDFLKGTGHSSYYLKTRFAHVSGDDNIIANSGYQKLDPSYNELRIELNYLF